MTSIALGLVCLLNKLKVQPVILLTACFCSCGCYAFNCCCYAKCPLTACCCYVFKGLLSAVTSLNAKVLESMVTLTWTPPFTLNIIGIHPSIQYCVDVIKTGGSSTCGINSSEFNTPLPADSGCHGNVMFTVTPVNVVGHGTPASLNVSEHITARKCNS